MEIDLGNILDCRQLREWLWLFWWPHVQASNRIKLECTKSWRVILRLASLLLLGLFGRSKVERASVLLAVKKTSVEYIVTTGSHRPDNLLLLAVNYIVKPACAGVSHCWRVSPYAVLWASDRTIGAGQMFPTRLVKKPHSGPTLLPAPPSLVRPFTPLPSRLANKITRDDCTCSVNTRD
jgi:hypothetical protein